MSDFNKFCTLYIVMKTLENYSIDLVLLLLNLYA